MIEKRERCGGTEGKPNKRLSREKAVDEHMANWHAGYYPDGSQHHCKDWGCASCPGCYSCDKTNWCACGERRTQFHQNGQPIAASLVCHDSGTPLGEGCKDGPRVVGISVGRWSTRETIEREKALRAADGSGSVEAAVAGNLLLGAEHVSPGQVETVLEAAAGSASTPSPSEPEAWAIEATKRLEYVYEHWWAERPEPILRRRKQAALLLQSAVGEREAKEAGPLGIRGVLSVLRTRAEAAEQRVRKLEALMREADTYLVIYLHRKSDLRRRIQEALSRSKP